MRLAYPLTVKGGGPAKQGSFLPRPRSLLALIRPEEGWSTFILLAALLLTITASVEASNWVKTLPPLGWIALGALLIGMLLAKFKVPAILLHPLGLLVGIPMILWQTASILPGTWEEQLVKLGVRAYLWYQAASTGGINNDSLLFVLMLVALTWGLGYLSAWFIFRSHRVWWALVPSGLAILVNLSYAPTALGSYFFLFLLAAMLLVVRVDAFLREQRWARGGTTLLPGAYPILFGNTLLISIAALILVWSLPVGQTWSELADSLYRFNSPWRGFQTEFNRLFASLTAKKPVGLHTFGSAAPFRGGVSLGSNVVMEVAADLPGYWRAHTYDVYTGQGWLTSERDSRPLQEVNLSAEKEFLLRKEVTQTIKPYQGSEVFFATGQAVRVTRPASAELAKPSSFLIDLDNPAADFRLPLDLQGYARRVRGAFAGGASSSPRTSPSRGEVLRQLPPGVASFELIRRAETVEAVRLIREAPSPPDVTTLHSPAPIRRFQEYTVLSSVSMATAKDLREAGTSYPSWVTDRYLQLPDALPSRVRLLAQQITQRADNPYDRVVAIDAQLRRIPYSLSIDAPPPEADGVDFFLFTTRRGYCDYYASAMVVMLRSLGIPARFVTGYVTGDYDPDRQVYVVRELHAHSWPEVFFPRYGWVEFNPTPAWPTLERSEGSLGADIPTDVEGLDLGPFFEDEDYWEDYDASLVFTGGGPLIPFHIAWPLGALAFLVLVAGGYSYYMLERGLAGLPYAAQIYEKTCRLASWARLGPRLPETPGEYARRLRALLPWREEGIHALAEAYVRSQFGKKALSPEEEGRVRRAWPALRRELLFRLLRRR